MSQMLELVKDWGRYSTGAKLRVLGHMEPIPPEGFCVDPERAATLLKDGFAVDAAEAKRDRKTSRRSTAKKETD